MVTPKNRESLKCPIWHSLRMETRLSPPDKEPTPRVWGARLCSKMTAHLATARSGAPVGPRPGGGGLRRPDRDGRDRGGKRKRGPSVSPWRGNSRRPAPRRRSAGDVREPRKSVRPAVEAGDSALLGLEAGRGGASILGQESGDGGARILAGRGGLTIFAHTRRPPGSSILSLRPRYGAP